jgi:hypothetical protein
MSDYPILLDRPKAAEFLGGISVRKLDQLADAKLIDRVNIGKRVFFRIETLEKFAKRGTK